MFEYSVVVFFSDGSKESFSVTANSDKQAVDCGRRTAVMMTKNRRSKCFVTRVDVREMSQIECV